MKIESAKYMKFDPSHPDIRPGIDCINAVIDGHLCGVPIDEENTDYQAILAWVAEGNTCLLYTSPSPRDGLLSRMPSSA